MQGSRQKLWRVLISILALAGALQVLACSDASPVPPRATATPLPPTRAAPAVATSTPIPTPAEREASPQDFFSDAGIRVTKARTIRVIDGDTILVEKLEGPRRGGEYRVRYIGIDAPETVHPEKPVEPFGPEAAAANRMLVEKRVVYLERDVSDTDRYGRQLRYVWIAEKRFERPVMVNELLLYWGYAVVTTFPPDVKYQQHFLDLQREAREAGRGLWAD